MFDFVRVSGSWENRWTEYVDHLHEHFVDPVRIKQGRYIAPSQPGFGVQLRKDSIAKYRYPDGPAWG
jgi:L-fuconate dehydratase